MRLAFHTPDQIADTVGLSQPQIADVLKNIGNCKLAESDKPAANHLADFNPPVYNVWRFQEKTTSYLALYGALVTLSL